jgi:death-on-curing protein
MRLYTTFSLLESGLACAQQQYAYAGCDQFDLGAAYAVAVIRNYSFTDGNKRTGLVISVLFLERSGMEFTAPEAEATQAVLSLVAGELNDSEFADNGRPKG